MTPPHTTTSLVDGAGEASLSPRDFGSSSAPELSYKPQCLGYLMQQVTPNPNPMADPAVIAAIANAERMAVGETTQIAILETLQRLESHMDKSDGRLDENESELRRVGSSLASHLSQIVDRQEFDRLVSLEHRVGAIESKDTVEGAEKRGAAGATRQFVAIAIAGLGTVMGLVTTVVGPILKHLIGLD